MMCYEKSRYTKEYTEGYLTQYQKLRESFQEEVTMKLESEDWVGISQAYRFQTKGKASVKAHN